MDQVKDILKKAIQYRFWIAVGIAALMPMIAYFAAAGSLKEETTTKEAAIKSASGDVKQYESGIMPNADYKTLTDERTAKVEKAVNSAWQKLYSRQEHLLSWPEEVEQYYKAWGPKWPEDVDPSFVAQTALTYAQVYPAEVEKVYRSFRPFNFEDGTGVVAAPERDNLLQPANFDMTKFDINNPPSYGKVWAAQQKLWIQGVVLDVIDKVNADAQNWDEAPVKEIRGLQVANPAAQDQRSIAKGVELELAPEILKPGTESAAADTGGGGGGDMAGTDMGMMNMMASMGAQMRGGMMGGMSGGGPQTAPDEVYFLKSENASPAFQTAPVYVKVLVDQARMLDLFDAFSRSPMAIQIVDFEMKRPTEPVRKPEKGENTLFNTMGGASEYFLGGAAMMGGRMGMMGMGADSMASYASGMRSGMAGMYGGQMEAGMMGGMYGGMMGGAPAKKSGTNIRQEQIKRAEEKAKAKTEDAEKKKDTEKPGADPYFYVIELHLYGQARFYNPPPAETPAEAPESAGNTPEGETAAEGTEAPAAEGETAAEAKTDEAPADAAAVPPAEAAPTEPGAQPSTEGEGEAPKAEEPAPADAPPATPEAPADAPPAEEPKAEAPPAGGTP